jgi:hypothetical protein
MIRDVCRGCCPNCGSDKLTYKDPIFEGDCMGYVFTCDTCGKHGFEWYDLSYTESMIYDED